MNPPDSPSLFQLALDLPVVRRAAIMAIVVGSLLVLINHGMCVARGHFGTTCMIQAAMTFLVPYAVSTVSSVQAIHCRMNAEKREVTGAPVPRDEG